VAAVRELRQLREKNSKLNRLVADLALDNRSLTEIVRRKFSARASAGFFCWTSLPPKAATYSTVIEPAQQQQETANHYGRCAGLEQGSEHESTEIKVPQQPPYRNDGAQHDSCNADQSPARDQYVVHRRSPLPGP
jgi:hypothetical protein